MPIPHWEILYLWQGEHHCLCQYLSGKPYTSGKVNTIAGAYTSLRNITPLANWVWLFVPILHWEILYLCQAEHLCLCWYFSGKPYISGNVSIIVCANISLGNNIPLARWTLLFGPIPHWETLCLWKCEHHCLCQYLTKKHYTSGKMNIIVCANTSLGNIIPLARWASLLVFISHWETLYLWQCVCNHCANTSLGNTIPLVKWTSLFVSIPHWEIIPLEKWASLFVPNPNWETLYLCQGEHYCLCQYLTGKHYTFGKVNIIVCANTSLGNIIPLARWTSLFVPISHWETLYFCKSELHCLCQYFTEKHYTSVKVLIIACANTSLRNIIPMAKWTLLFAPMPHLETLYLWQGVDLLLMTGITSSRHEYFAELKFTRSNLSVFCETLGARWL